MRAKQRGAAQLWDRRPAPTRRRRRTRRQGGGAGGAAGGDGSSEALQARAARGGRRKVCEAAAGVGVKVRQKLPAGGGEGSAVRVNGC